VSHRGLHETSRHLWDLETVPDLGGFVAANDLVDTFGDFSQRARTIAIYECTALKKSGLAT
jgi:hypothetical protein